MPRATWRTWLRSAEPSSPGGVPTAMNTTCAGSTASLRSVEKVSRPTARLRRTISSRPGSKIGTLPSCNMSILALSTSTQVTLTPNSAKQVPVTSPTYPVPTTAIFMTLSRIPLRISGLLLEPVPFHEPADPFLDPDLRRIPEHGAGVFEVGAGLSHVARLIGLRHDLRGLSQRGFDVADQLAQADDFGASQVEDLVAAAVLQGGDDPGDDVLDVGVVPRRGSVPEQRDRLPLVDQAGELVNRHLGALARAVDREEAQARHVHAVEMVIAVGQQLAGALGGGVRRDRRVGRDLLGEWRLVAVAVDRGGGAEQKPRHLVDPGVLHQR